jgi:hypothetical protein
MVEGPFTENKSNCTQLPVMTFTFVLLCYNEEPCAVRYASAISECTAV